VKTSSVSFIPALLRLFNAVPISEHTKLRHKPDAAQLKKTLACGYMFSPEIYSLCGAQGVHDLIEEIDATFLDGEKLNSAFHKSWKKICEASMEELVIEQMFHYVTTYGFEAFHIFDHDTVYIPMETLKVPRVRIKDMSITVICGLTKEEIKKKVFHLLSSGIAMSAQTRDDVMELLMYTGFNPSDIGEINNKEVRCIMYAFINSVPQDAAEFLRYVIYKVNKNTLLIKDRATIESLKGADVRIILPLFVRYHSSYGYGELSKSFYRFKPMFLALRTSKPMKKVVNRIRKLAIKNHEPMKQDFLNSVTRLVVEKGFKAIQEDLDSALKSANIFRKIRLAYSLKYRASNPSSILYRIRNGKGYATSIEVNKVNDHKLAFNYVLKEIAKSLKHLHGMKVYIPEGVEYALPSTEKQFVGNVPSGSCITVDDDMIIGVHWNNTGDGVVEDDRVDLDLSLLDENGSKIGWDADYRDESCSILFSGDMTDAPMPNGATELFRIKKQDNLTAVMALNFFNHYHNNEKEVPFKIVVGSYKSGNKFEKNFMLDPNEVIARVDANIGDRQKTIGLLVINKVNCKFYFMDTDTSKGNSSYGGSEVSEHIRSFMVSYYENAVKLSEVLKLSGAVLVKSKAKADLDLSPEALQKDTIISLLHNNS